MWETKNYKAHQVAALVSFSVLATRKRKQKINPKMVIISRGRILMANEPKIILGYDHRQINIEWWWIMQIRQVRAPLTILLSTQTTEMLETQMNKTTCNHSSKFQVCLKLSLLIFCSNKEFLNKFNVWIQIKY